MINPFQDAPEDLCRRILAILDELYDEEVGQLASGPPDLAFIKMLELRVHMTRSATNMNMGKVSASFNWPLNQPPVYTLSGGPYSITNPPVITYTAPGTPGSGRKFWRKPRGSGR